MKHIVLVFVATCLALSFTKDSGYVIKGVAKGADGQKIVLKEIRDFKPVGIDSVVVHNGAFTLKGSVACPEFCLLFVGDQGPVQFFIENSAIQITIDIEHIEKSKITGSKENDIFQEFVANMETYGQQAKSLNEAYVALKSSNGDNPEKEKEITSQLEKVQSERTKSIYDFVTKYPNRIVTAFIIDNLLLPNMEIGLLKKVVNSYDSTLDQSQWVQLLKKSYATVIRLEIGQPFPDITLKTPTGQSASLSDYAGKGKYVLVDFWASWCGPCRRANPQVVELYNRYKNKGFEIVGISLDRDKNAWVKAIEDDKLTWPQMSDLNYWQSEATKLFSVSSIPYTILLDKDGKIIAKGLHTGELDEKLAGLMD